MRVPLHTSYWGKRVGLKEGKKEIYKERSEEKMFVFLPYIRIMRFAG